MRRLFSPAAAALTFLVYAGAIGYGLYLYSHHTQLPWTQDDRPHPRNWQRASMSDLDTATRADVAYGSRLFNETPAYGSQFTRSRISCGNCHLGGGTAPHAAPVVGSMQAYPTFSKRAKRDITLEDRIEECMTRSEDGTPLPHDSPEMKALIAYIDWLSAPHANELPISGRGLGPMPDLTPDPQHGADVYAAQCAGCHGASGEGHFNAYPPLWGPDAFNDGAGMDTIPKLSAFIRWNMPQNRKGTLSPQDATDVAAFIHMQPRPKFNHAYDRF